MNSTILFHRTHSSPLCKCKKPATDTNKESFCSPRSLYVSNINRSAWWEYPLKLGTTPAVANLEPRKISNVCMCVKLYN